MDAEFRGGIEELPEVERASESFRKTKILFDFGKRTLTGLFPQPQTLWGAASSISFSYSQLGLVFP